MSLTIIMALRLDRRTYKPLRGFTFNYSSSYEVVRYDQYIIWLNKALSEAKNMHISSQFTLYCKHRHINKKTLYFDHARQG